MLLCYLVTKTRSNNLFVLQVYLDLNNIKIGIVSYLVCEVFFVVHMALSLVLQYFFYLHAICLICCVNIIINTIWKHFNHSYYSIQKSSEHECFNKMEITLGLAYMMIKHK